MDNTKTVEFWVTLLTNISLAILALFVGYQLVTQEQADLWMGLILAVIPLAAAWLSKSYIQSVANVRTSKYEAELWHKERGE